MTSVADYDYDLPERLIAQTPAAERDGSRLLVIHRGERAWTHARFQDFPRWLKPGDVLVLNDSRVIPARLRAVKPESHGQIEVLLVEENGPNDWWALLRPGKRVRPGTRLVFRRSTNPAPAAEAVVEEKNLEGHCRLRFTAPGDILDALNNLGEIPLPPYINRARSGPDTHDRDRYQTVYAAQPGSVAAPTAGLHFTPAVLQRLREAGVHVHSLTLHVGLGTFAPVKSDTLEGHRMHEERFRLPEDTVLALRAAQAEGRRIVAAGTTVVRVLEHVAQVYPGDLQPCAGRTDIFIHPPRRFRVVDALLTNFHLPRSTLLMLVSAFAAPGSTGGRDLILRAYQEAVREGYRFFSYGDAMFIH